MLSQNVYIGEHNVPCVIGLNWFDDPIGNQPHAVLKLDGKPNQFGYSSEDNDTPITEGNSLAVWAAETFINGIVVSSVSTLDNDGETDIKYWMCAISEGVILPETDRTYNTMSELEDAILDAMEVVNRDSVYQLCSAPIRIAGIEFIFYELTIDSFRSSMQITSRGMSGKIKLIITSVVLAIIMGGGFAYYLYDQHQKELAAEQARRAAILAQQMAVENVI